MYIIICMHIAEQVRSLRLSLGLTQSQLATLAKVSLPTIQNIEAGRANPGLDVVERIY
ncbi:MAG: XRE family transcriptional regulator, partial [Bdellovibrio sp. CG10_big_fil_rev_8_21_14_0_10_47_8]